MTWCIYKMVTTQFSTCLLLALALVREQSYRLYYQSTGIKCDYHPRTWFLSVNLNKTLNYALKNKSLENGVVVIY